MKRSSKRVAAGILALSMVPGMMPGCVGDVLTWSSTVFVHAAEFSIAGLNVDDVLDLDEAITVEDEAGDEGNKYNSVWQFIAAPGTVLIKSAEADENKVVNTESVIFTEVTEISTEGIKAAKMNGSEIPNWNKNGNGYVEFIAADERDHFDEGDSGIFISAINNEALSENEKPGITLSANCNKATEGRYLEFTEEVYDAITSIKVNDSDYDYKAPNFAQKLDHLKTGDRVIVKSTKALDFKNKEREVDVKFDGSQKEVDETATAENEKPKYTYTITVGRDNIESSIREITYGVENVDGTDEIEAIVQDFSSTPVTINNLANKMQPDIRYKVVSQDEDLAVFVDLDKDGHVDENEPRIASPRSLVSTSPNTYNYTFTAPYDNVIITRADQNWNFAVTENGEEITATSADIADEDVVYRYGFNVDVPDDDPDAGFVPYSLTEPVIHAGDASYDFKLSSVDDTNEAESQAVWSNLSCQIIYRYKDMEGTLIEKPVNAGTYKVVADIYLYDEDGSCSTDGEGDFHVEKAFKITPIDLEMTVVADGEDVNYRIDDSKYWSNVQDDDKAWIRPNVKVSVGGTPLEEGTDYVIEGDVTSTEAGPHTLVVVGINNYDGVVGTFVWYSSAAFDSCIIDENGAAIDELPFAYGKSFNFALDEFDGDQEDVTYQIGSVFEKRLAEAYLEGEAAQKVALRNAYETIFGEGSFVQPTEVPEPVSVTEDLVIDVKSFDDTAVKAILTGDNDAAKEPIVDAIELLTNDDGLDANEAIEALKTYINIYTVEAVSEEETVAEAEITIVAKEVAISVNNRNVTFDGTDHRAEYKLVAEELLEKDASAINTELGKIAIALDDDEGTVKAPVIAADDYRFIASLADVENALGLNYTVAEGSKYDEDEEDPDNELVVVAEATVDPLNLNGFAIVSAPETILVTNGGNNYKKPAITVTSPDGNELIKGTDFNLAGTISANTGGDYTTRIQGKNNYTGTIKFDWTVLDGESFKNAIALSWKSMTGVINSSGKPAIKYTFNRKEVPEFSEGFEVTALGYVYANEEGNDALTAADLTIENKGKTKHGNTIKVKNANTVSFNGNYSLSIVDNSYGVTARAFVTLKNVATNTEWTVYIDEYAGCDIESSDYDTVVNEQMTHAFTLAEVQTPPVAYTENNKNKLQAKFTITKEENASENVRVVEAGYIYSNVAAPTSEADIEKWQTMTLEAANDTTNTFIKKSSKTTANMGSYTVKFVDNGAGVRYRGFIVVENEDGARYTKYIDYTAGDPADGTFADYGHNVSCATFNFAAVSRAQINSLVVVVDELMDNAALTNDRKPAAQFGTKRKLQDGVSADGVTVSEYGFIYANDLAIAPALANFTVENANASTSDSIKIKTKTGSTISSEYSRYSINIKKVEEKNVYVRGFVKVKDNKTGIEQYVYAAEVKHN